MLIEIESTPNVVFKMMINNCTTQEQVKSCVTNEIIERINYRVENSKQQYQNKYANVLIENINTKKPWGVTGNPKH